MAKEPLSEATNVRREQLLTRVEGLTKPPQLPPRGTKKVSTSFINENAAGIGKTNEKKVTNVSTISELDSSRDYISEQREIARRQKGAGDVAAAAAAPEMPAPYASRKKHLISESEQVRLTLIY